LSLSDTQVDKVSFSKHAIEARPPTVLIRSEQADTTQDKNVLIGEPHVAPNVETNSGCKVVLEKDGEGKNKLKYHRWINTVFEQATVVRNGGGTAEGAQACNWNPRNGLSVVQ
jgi:hypothetical protein